MLLKVAVLPEERVLAPAVVFEVPEEELEEELLVDLFELELLEVVLLEELLDVFLLDELLDVFLLDEEEVFLFVVVEPEEVLVFVVVVEATAFTL